MIVGNHSAGAAGRDGRIGSVGLSRVGLLSPPLCPLPRDWPVTPAGKSSFINWYVGEELQTTGVAVETQGPGRTVCNFL